METAAALRPNDEATPLMASLDPRAFATEESIAQSYEELRVLFRRVVTADDRDELRRAIDDLTDLEVALKVARSDGSFALVDGLLSLVNSRLVRVRRHLEGAEPT